MNAETDEGRFLTAINKMFAMFGSLPDEVLLDGYWEALKDCEIGGVEYACAEATKTNAFRPTPFELRSLIRDKARFSPFPRLPPDNAINARLNARVATVMQWLLSLGACGICSMGMAVAQVDKEQGRKPYDWKTFDGQQKPHPCTEACAKRARSAYQTLPSLPTREPGEDDDETNECGRAETATIPAP